MKKTLTVRFYTDNANVDFNANKNIININNYPDKKNLVQNKNPINQKDLNVELVNSDAGKSLIDQFGEVYKKQIGLGYY